MHAFWLFLRNVYNVDFVVIPPFKTKQYKQLATIIADDFSRWISQIVITVGDMVEMDRAILIICDSILEANSIREQIE